MGQIISFLPSSHRAFSPQDVQSMSEALEDVCQHLGIDGSSTARQMIAMRIIEFARRGERNPATLRDRVLAESSGGTGC